MANVMSPESEFCEPPVAAKMAHLKPTDIQGVWHLGFGAAITHAALALSFFESWILWGIGQALLALAGLFWFAALHEAGHRTLFHRNLWNSLAGHIAGFLAFIPFDCWKPVHAKHHQWTGWQDLDMTTASLVPRKLSHVEIFALNFCWWLCIPVFALLYRLGNYWNLPRLWKNFTEPWRRRRFALGIALCSLGYASILAWIGPLELLGRIGLGIYLSFVLQDLLILSQHTHIPMRVSEGLAVRSYSPQEQVVFTRSLILPTWFAHLILLNMNAHELHHMHPQVPGYCLSSILCDTEHAVPWWRWILHAKTRRADVLLFQNWDQTGYRV